MNTTDEQARIAGLYRDFATGLCGLMHNRFGIPEEDAENLVHDIFATLLRTRAVLGNEEKWLIGAACNASRSYWRQEKTNVALSDEMTVPSSPDDHLALGQILDRLPARARDILRLRYLEGLSGNEIAERYGTSVEYTHLLIHRSLEKARALAKEND